MPEIKIENLSKTFGNAHAVQDVSLTIKDSSFTCILGPSGCGKTTLLRMIAGLEGASSGSIRIGTDVVDAPSQGTFMQPDQRGIGLVFQSYALWPHMTVAQNVEFGLTLQRRSQAERRARIAAMLDLLRIADLADRYPSQLSGGQQQRVALARSMALAPKVLLLDEPLSNLDAALRLALRAELSRLHREFGTTIVFVTHDQWEAMTLATDIVVLAGGRVQQMGRAIDIYDAPSNRFVAEFVGNPPINNFAAGSPTAAALIPLEMKHPSEITVGLRPEAVQISTAPSPNALVATVGALIPTGGSWIVEITLPHVSDPVLHIVATRPDLAPSQRVFITPNPSGLHFFAPDGRAIPMISPSQKETQ